MELAKPLQELWAKSLANDTVPNTLKTGIITLIHKGGSRGLPKQYRPVVLTSHIITVCVTVIRKQMVNFFRANNIYNEGQQGFRQNCSCLSQLLIHYEKVLRCI